MVKNMEEKQKQGLEMDARIFPCNFNITETGGVFKQNKKLSWHSLLNTFFFIKINRLIDVSKLLNQNKNMVMKKCWNIK